jgi:membrane protein implicated in regulation of membrane protease activity
LNKRYTYIVVIYIKIYKGEGDIMFDGIPYPVLWLVVAVILGIVEALTVGIITIWFAIGALFAMILALLGLPFYIQVISFIVVSSVLLYFTKPIVKDFLKVKAQRTNADKVLDEEGIVIERIDQNHGLGQVKVRGQVWSARSFDGQDVEEGETVEIQEISGVKLIVKRKTDNN